ncbi:actin, partial [Reticulomyxa filosa]
MEVGFSDDVLPQTVFPTVLGRPKHKGITGQKDVYIGTEAQNKKEILDLKYPIERSIITNWDDMENLWHYIFHEELNIEPEEYIMLLTESPLTPKVNREKIVQIMFEIFNTSGVFLGIQPHLFLY